MDIMERIIELEMTIADIDFQLASREFPDRGDDWSRRARYRLGRLKSQLDAANAAIARLDLLREMEDE